MHGTSYTLNKTSSLHGKGTEDSSVNLSSASVKKLLLHMTRGQHPLLACRSPRTSCMFSKTRTIKDSLTLPFLTSWEKEFGGGVKYKRGTN